MTFPRKNKKQNSCIGLPLSIYRNSSFFQCDKGADLKLVNWFYAYLGFRYHEKHRRISFVSETNPVAGVWCPFL